jgi:hypothetical protein
MKHLLRLFSALIFLGLGAHAHAQSSLDDGRAVLARLSDAKLRKQLIAKPDKLSIYVGRIRVGAIEMTNTVVGKGLVLTDTLELRVDGLGQVSLESKQTINERGELVEAMLSTRAPQSTGKIIRRSYVLRRKGNGFLWRKTVDKKVEEKTIEAAPNSLALVAPVGLSARLPKAVTEAGRMTFLAIDIKTGTKTRMRLNIDPFEEHNFRGRKISCRLVTRREAGASLECLLDPSLSVLQMSFDHKRLKAAGGTTSSERFENLPEAFSGVPTDPAAAVIVFFRSVAKGLKKDMRAAIDFEAMFKDSVTQSGKAPQKGEKEAFMKALMAKLTNEAWLRENRLSVNSGALELNELKSTIKGNEARVYLPGGGAVALVQSDGRWKVAGFIAPKSPEKK